ncbi:translocation protein SEC63 homolog [Halichondria panicea]|uniref:translocation protein SEC63 homolog n=1 Tax=Halichondria panicea TaxID=6063 RepID=UPI00312B8225
MARAKLEYDDSGSTFFYFLISFYLLILLPLTYYLWPKKKTEKPPDYLVCQCGPCVSKKALLDREKPSNTYKNIAKVALLVVLWALLVFMVYKVATADHEYQEYDPFEILQLDPSATMSEIKKQYRRLSKVYHPDKQGGNQEMFMKIAKAYEALTDDVSRENWEKYGNPDGPQAATFGIALPSWIVEKDNSIWVLVLYMAVFAIVLPVIVGVWWYRSIKYGSTNVLLQTSQIYLYFMARSKSITPKRVVMILTAAFEFNSDQSPLVKKRPSDDMELSEIIQSKALPHIDIKTKENPFGAPYAAKARILVHAHLERMERFRLRPDTLAIDQQAILKLCPQLIQEMISALIQYWVYCKQKQTQPPPSVDVFECIMSVSQMMVQGMWAKGSSPILQLPHISHNQLKHFRTKKRNITSLDEFVAMKDTERRLLVRALSDEEYYNVMAVCSMFPHVELITDMHVVDDFTSKKITAGSLVTVSVTMTRVDLFKHHNIDMEKLTSSSDHDTPPLPLDGAEMVPVETVGGPEEDGAEEEKKDKLTKIWEANKKRKKGKPAKKKTTNPKKVKKSKVVIVNTPETPPSGDEASEDGGHGDGGHGNGDDIQGDGSDHGDRDVVEGSEDEEAPKDDEEDWDRLQKNMKKQKELDQRATDSHPVHGPHFPTEKQECWWLYIVNRKKRELVCPPQRIVGLKEKFSTDLQFAAPENPGTLRYSIVLNSDCYLDLSFQQEIEVVVDAAVVVSGTDQWKDLEEDEEEEGVIEETDSEGGAVSSSEYEDD